MLALGGSSLGGKGLPFLGTSLLFLEQLFGVVSLWIILDSVGSPGSRLPEERSGSLWGTLVVLVSEVLKMVHKVVVRTLEAGIVG